jgi:AcrR family transcriptional regulator
MGLRERKKLETFRTLQSAARRLVGERGVDNVTVEDIAAAANVSKRTFFNYFESKEAALFEPEPGRVERLATALAERPTTETPLSGLRTAAIMSLTSYADDLQELTGIVCANPGLTGLFLKSFEPFERVIIDWAAERTGTDPEVSVYPSLLAAVTNVMRRLTVARWQPETGDEGFIELAEEIFDLLARGLPAPGH